MAEVLFVGRRDELARFAGLLTELTTAGKVQRGRWWRRRRSGSGGAGAAGSRVVLVHGLGGSGKSRLLKHFQGMAQGTVAEASVRPGRVVAAWLDWEDERRNDPGAYTGVAGPSLVTVLDAVQKTLVSAFDADARATERATRAFDSYRQGAARMPEYAARFAEVVAQSQQGGSGFTPADATALAKTAASIGLATAGHPDGLAGLSPDQLATSTQAVGHLSGAAVRAVTGKKPGDVPPEEYDLVTDPARELTRRVAAAIRAIADRIPLVILLDTGEVIDVRAWVWLRHVMNYTGPRVAWVVGARFESEAEAGADSPIAQFVRDIGDEHLMLMSPTRFDDVMIQAYLQKRTKTREFTIAQIDLIARFTRGLPLAVSFTATLLADGQSVEEVCREVGDGQPSSVISQLARRYLVHAEQQTYPPDDPRRGDVAKILGLALAFGDLRSDPELLGALWNVADPLPVLEDLARRHDFVLLSSRRLHDDVRDTLRIDLLDPYRRDRVREINQRALDLFSTRLEQMRSRWPTLDKQLAHPGFTTALLTVLWHTLWTGNQAGLDLFTEILPVLAAVDRPAANTAAVIMNQFAATFNDDQRHDLDLLTEARPSFLDERLARRWGATTRPKRQVKITLSGLTLTPHCAPAAGSLVGQAGDRHTAVMILQATLQAADRDDHAAVTTLETAASQATSTRLRQAIGSCAQGIATRLIWAGPRGTSVRTATGLEAAKIATETLPDNASAWQSYGPALNRAGRSEDALAAYDRALELDPNNAHAHSNRGVALGALGRYQDALAAYDRALQLDPNNAHAHTGQGEPLQALGRYQDALAAHDRALQLDPNNAHAHSARGVALGALGRYQDAQAAHDRALQLDPNNAHAHSARGVALRRVDQLEDALAAYDRALQLDPGDAHAHSNRGVALGALGRYQDALAAYDRALQLGTNNAAAHENKGIILAIIGDLDNALTELDTARDVAPDSTGEGLTWAAAILWHRGDAAAARDRFALVGGRVTGCTPFSTAAMEAIALCGLGRPADAERHLLAVLPLRLPGDRSEFRAIYDLLSDPPLPGMDRLHTIALRES